MVGAEAHEPAGNEVDARRIQRFLEAAAPIILESRSLDDARFESVMQLADQMGVGRAELRRELRWLTRRGVIYSAPWEKLERAVLQEAESKSQPDDSDAQSEAQRAAPAPVQPPPAPQAGPVPVRVAKASKAKTFRRRRGATAVRQEPDSAKVPEPDPAPAETQIPQPPEKLFAAWLDGQLHTYPSALLAEDDERSLIGVGVHRHHLAEVLARHVVRDVAARYNIRPERDLVGASEHSTVAAGGSAVNEDETLRQFFDQVAPILALHRGINTQSRILLSAVAQQMGLTEEQFDRAILQLQQSPRQTQGNDPRQVERLESYRRYLRRAIAQLQDSIITFQTQQRLEEAGEYFHGVLPPLIVPTIKEVASEVGARFLSRQQAVEHIAALINDVWNRGQMVTGQTRVRVYAEGTRWGLEPMDVETILREQSQIRRDQTVAEQRHVRRLVLLTAIALGLVVTLFAWMLWPFGSGLFLTKQVDEKKPAARPIVERPSDWRSAELRIAIAGARAKMPDKRKLLAGIDSKLPSARATTYEQLVQTCLEESDDPAARNTIGPLLVNLYVCDPSEPTAEALAKSLLAPIVAAESHLPADPAEVKALFWSCDTALQAWKNPKVPEKRAQQLGELLQSAVGSKLGRGQEAGILQRSCFSMLTKRLYGLLTRVAPAQPDLVTRLYDTVKTQADRCLDATTRDELEITLLTAILPVIGERWTTFNDTIRALTRSRNPGIVLKMAKIHGRTSDPVLQSFLADLFSERLGVNLQTVSSAEFEDQVRSLLGIADTEQEAQQWSALEQQAHARLDNAPVAETNADVLLGDVLELAYLATVACALDRRERGKTLYAALTADGPPKLDLGAGPWTKPVSDIPRASPSLASAKFVEKYVYDLRGARLVLQRIRLLGMIDNYVDQTPDVSVQTGQALAHYLTRYKTDVNEQRAVLKVAGRLAQWSSVRLGLADVLADPVGRGKQMTELYCAVLESPTSLDTADARLQTRRTLLSSVGKQLASERPVSHELGPVYGQAKKALTDQYKKQASLLGVPADKAEAVDRPSTMLTLLLQQQKTRMAGTSLQSRDGAFIEQLDRELTAAQFVVDNDLEYTVLVAHLWARMLALRVAQDNSALTPKACELVARMGQLDRRSSTVFEQLRHVHAILLELWLLRRPTDSSVEGA